MLVLFRAFRPNSFPSPDQGPKDIRDILKKANIGKIRDDLEAMKKDVGVLMTAVVPAGEASAETLRDILTSTRDEARAMRATFTGLASALTSFTDEVRAMRATSTDLVGEMTATRDEVGAIREEVQRLRAVVATLVIALFVASSEL